MSGWLAKRERAGTTSLQTREKEVGTGAEDAALP